MLALPLIAALAFSEPSAATAPPVIAAQAERPVRSRYVEGTLNLAVGERVVLRPRADGGFEMVEARFVGLEAALPPTPGTRPDIAALFPAEPGTVAVSLGMQQGVGSFLKIENRLDGSFSYMGLIVGWRDGRPTEPDRTTVCTVSKDKLGFEHWAGPIIQMVMGNLQVLPDALPVCETEESIRGPVTATPPTT